MDKELPKKLTPAWPLIVAIPGLLSIFAVSDIIYGSFTLHFA